ncbi:MAG: amidohydrolase family protein [Blastocatellia bacterium]
MKKIPLFLLFLLPALLAQSQPSSQSKPLVFTHVTVIDATGAAAKPDMTVVLTGERITEIGKSGKVRIPREAQIVDATGKFLIPGLWDMHIHWYQKDYLPLFIANGVTGVRQMWGFPMHYEWRKEMGKGALLGPRMNIASAIVDGPQPIHRGSIAVGNEAEARQAVIKSKQDGAEFIKVYSLLSREAYFAIADEAKKQGIPFAGHVPRSVTAAEVSDVGQKSIEHLSGVAFACSSREAELPADLAELRKEVAAGANYLSLLRRLEAKHLDTYSEQKASALFARFKQNATWQVPTLTVLRGGAFLDDPNFTNDPRLKYLPAEIRARWEPKNNRVFQNSTAADFASLKKVFAKQLQIVGEMRRAGVELLAGTDVLNPYCFPGFSLHDELALLVKAGLTPMEALQAATRNPARYLGLLDSLGTVEKGKIADLVLLEANPLAEISNTQKINAVIVGGKLIAKSEIEAMLAKVEAAANKK